MNDVSRSLSFILNGTHKPQLLPPCPSWAAEMWPCKVTFLCLQTLSNCNASKVARNPDLNKSSTTWCRRWTFYQILHNLTTYIQRGCRSIFNLLYVTLALLSVHHLPFSAPVSCYKTDQVGVDIMPHCHRLFSASWGARGKKPAAKEITKSNVQ